MIDVIKKKPAILVAAALMVFALAMLAGCGGGAKSIIGTWHFTEITPSEASMKDLDDSQKADREAEATMLSVFMSDAQAEFAEDGTFTFTFLGDKYQGKWEEADGGVRVTMDGQDYTSAGGVYKIKDNKLVFEADSSDGRLSGYVVTYESGPASGAEASNSVVTNEGSSSSSSEASPSASAPAASETPSEAAAPSEGAQAPEASNGSADSSAISDAAESIASGAASEAASAASSVASSAASAASGQ